MYADYSYYSNQFGGKMSNDDYAVYGKRATDYISAVTFHRVTAEVLSSDIGEAVKRCCCAIAEKLLIAGETGSKTAEKVGSYSVSYHYDTPEQREKELYKTALIYLGDSGLMYRGC